MKSETPRNAALMRTKPPMWRQWQDADFCDLESLSKQLERELNEAKELMATAANWAEACPFDNSIIFAEKLRAAAMPNDKVSHSRE